MLLGASGCARLDYELGRVRVSSAAGAATDAGRQGSSQGVDTAGFRDSGGSSSVVDAGGDRGSTASVDAAGPDAGVRGRGFCSLGSPELRACYEMNGSLLDDSGYGNHLVGLGYAFGPGYFDRALLVSELSRFTPRADQSLDFSTGLTVEAWVEPLDGQERQVLALAGRWDLSVAAGGAARCAIVVGAGSRTSVAAGALPSGQWSHVACTYDGSELRLFVDGRLAAERAASGPLGVASGAGLGVAGTATSPYVGAIDNVRVWSIARSPAEVRCAVEGTC